MQDRTPVKLRRQDRRRIAQVIQDHWSELAEIKGFVDAEPGFLIKDGWVRREPAIIVHVTAKVPESELLAEDRAPRRVGGERVDLIAADPWRLLKTDPDTKDLADALQDVAAGGLTYEPRDGNPIDQALSVSTPILCHAGPDAGWPVLKSFIEGARSSLTAAMYDLNAGYVAKVLIDTVRDNDLNFVLTWDAGMTGEEANIRADLKAKLAGRMDAWIVRTGGTRRFDSAYHEKVAVRDSSSFWLSSGNWSKRSQPEIDPVGDASQARGMYSKGNREWHLVMEDTPLAKLFEDYILYDRDKSREEDTALAQSPPPVALPDLFVPLEALQDDEELALAAPNPVPPKSLPTHGGAFQVRPLLCPDNYLSRVTEFVRSAEKSLYLQYSYITYSEAARDAPFRQMLDELGRLSHRKRFDLRIIVGNNSAEDKVRKLVEVGFNETCLRVQSNVHNKGIIVDGRAVLVSSANWSAAGTLRNRDAGVIIHDAEVARYYEAIFLEDWQQRARSDFGRPKRVQLAAAGAATPPGMVRVGWRDYVGD